MGWSVPSYVLGLLLLAHAAYSSYENHQSRAVLLDSIKTETMYGVAFIMIGAFLSIRNKPLYTINGKTTDESDGILNDININESFHSGHGSLKPIHMSDAVEVIEKVGVNEYEELISRVDFVDVIKKRREFSLWQETRNKLDS